MTQFRGFQYWPTWFGIGSLFLLAKLPYPSLQRVGSGLGRLLYGVMRSRRRVALINLGIAFPDKSTADIQHLAKESFRHTAMSITETAACWFKSPDDILQRFEFHGREHLDAAIERGEGVILLQAHFTMVDICGVAVCAHYQTSSVYDPPKNPCFGDMLLKQRSRHLHRMIPNRDIRQMIRALRNGETVWFSPDQSVSTDHGGIEALFFQHPALTSAGTARIVGMTDATIIPMVPSRSADGTRYHIHFHAPFALPTNDVAQATQAVNDLLESQVAAQPEQYFWVHKRFKPPSAEHSNPYR